MANEAVNLSKYIISHEFNAHREVTNLRLQKLLYFVQAKLLISKEQASFNNKIVALQYGPVVVDSYENFKGYKRSPIAPSDSNISTPEGKELIDNMLDYLQKYQTYELVRITHNQKPWSDAISKGGLGTQITNESIKEYFQNVTAKQ